MILIFSLSLSELENFLLLCSGDCGPRKKRRMLRDDILSSFSGFEARRSGERRRDVLLEGSSSIWAFRRRSRNSEFLLRAVGSFFWTRDERKTRREKKFLIIRDKSRWFLKDTRRMRNKMGWFFLGHAAEEKIWFFWEKRIEIFSQKKRKNQDKRRCYQL